MIEHIEAYLKQHHCRDYFNAYGETVEDDHYFMYREEVDGLIELVVREVFAKIEDERFEVYESVKESVIKQFGVGE